MKLELCALKCKEAELALKALTISLFALVSYSIGCQRYFEQDV